MDSLSPAVKMNKATTLPPISDIFRGPPAQEPYHPQQPYANYRSLPMPTTAYYGAPYAAPVPEFGAPRYYPAPYGAANYTLSTDPNYAPAAVRDPWGQVHSVPPQYATSLPMNPQVHGAMGPRTMRYHSSSPDSVGQRSSTELSPKSAMAATTSKVRTRNNLPKEVTQVLLKWLNDHLSHPYPNSFEKAQLIMATGLNQQQLSNWFINARRRKIKALREGHQSSVQDVKTEGSAAA